MARKDTSVGDVQIQNELDRETMESAYIFFKDIPVKTSSSVYCDRVRERFPTAWKGDFPGLIKKVKAFTNKYDDTLKTIKKRLIRQKESTNDYYQEILEHNSCKKCDFKHREDGVMNEHVLRHINGEGCCSLSDSSQEWLRNLGSHYTRVVTFVCTKCEYSTSDKKAMNKHMHKEHVLTEANSEAERSAEWKTFKSSDFVHPGIKVEQDENIPPSTTPVTPAASHSSATSQTPFKTPLSSNTPVLKVNTSSGGIVYASQEVKNSRVRGGKVVKPRVLIDVSSHANTKNNNNITNNNDDVINSRISRQTKLRKAKQMDAAVSQISVGLSNEDQCRIISGMIDKQPKENIPLIQKHSKNLSESPEMSPELAAELSFITQTSQKQMRVFTRAARGNNTPIFPSEHKVEAAKRALKDKVSRDCYNIRFENLQIKSQGEKTHEMEPRPVVSVKNIGQLMQTILENEIDDLSELETLEDGTKVVQVVFTGDAGGDSMKHLFMIVNNKEGDLKEHVFLIYEAADTIDNSGIIYHSVREQFEILNNTIFSVNGSNYKVECYGVYDLSEQDMILQKQNSSSTLPCSKCKVTRNHLKAEDDQKFNGWKKGDAHDPNDENCCQKEKKDIIEFYEKNGRKAAEGDSDKARKLGKDNENVIGRPLFPYKSTDDLIDPLLHIVMGLGNDNIKHLKKDCDAMDEIDGSTSKKREEAEKLMEEAHRRASQQEESLELNKKISSLLYDMQRNRLDLVRTGDIDGARKAAGKYHRVASINRKDTEVCASEHCLVFPVDKTKVESAETLVDCENCENSFHILCEAASYKFADKYNCNKCEALTFIQINNKFEEIIKTYKDEENDLIAKIRKFNMIKKSKMDQLKNLRGKRLQKCYISMKELGTKEASYHGGGDLNGKDNEKIMKHVLSCQSYKDNKLLECISDDQQKAEKYHRLFTILANCWNILRHPPKAGPGTKMEDDELDTAIYWCEAWARELPQLFPDRHLTRKGHCLSSHITETLRKHKTFYMFYKAEQTGEAVHAKFNKLKQKWGPRRPKTERLWGMIQEYEVSNTVKSEVLLPRKRARQERVGS